MRIYKRQDFIKLPEMTIYSRVEYQSIIGLFCKTTNINDNSVDWLEQDLISNVLTENMYSEPIEEYFGFDNDFRANLNLQSRDGCFNDKNLFVVWDKEDVTKLRDYLNNVLK